MTLRDLIAAHPAMFAAALHMEPDGVRAHTTGRADFGKRAAVAVHCHAAGGFGGGEFHSSPPYRAT